MNSPTIIWASRSKACVECPHCHTIHDGVPVDQDGVDLDTQPCHDDNCTVKLCECCPQFDCEGCGLSHCQEHAVTLSWFKFCRVCTEIVAEEMAADVRELELAEQAEAACWAAMAGAGCTLETMRDTGRVS